MCFEFKIGLMFSALSRFVGEKSKQLNENLQ